MQITLTLDHLLIFIFCGFFLGIIFYVFVSYRKICQNISLAVGLLKRFHAHICRISKQVDDIMLHVEYMKTDTGLSERKSAATRPLSRCIDKG